ncbi:MAG: hypothetical protein K6T54_13725 [Ignavibacterium sp.]|nr:hypothetical protein [Ignavibacterium sp.]
MIDRIGVAAIPLSPFYSKPYENKLIRICFAKRDDILIEAGKRMEKL